jgi:hypothetical protein
MWWVVGAWGVILLLFNSALTKNFRSSYFAWLISYLTLLMQSLFLALRGDMGVDWIDYKEMYSLMPTSTKLLSEGDWLPFNIEPGYQIYMSILKLLNLHPNALPSVLFIISNLMVMHGCKKWVVPPLSMTAMMTMLIYPHYFGQIRMAFVYSLGVLVGLAILNKNRKYLFASSLLAASVQYIGIAYFLGLFIRSSSHYCEQFGYQRRIFFASAFLFFLTLSFFFSGAILSALIQLFALVDTPVSEKLVSYYFRAEEDNKSFLGAFVLIVFALSLLFFCNRESSENRRIVFLSSASLFVAVIILFITADFSVLSHRLISMVSLPTFAILMASVSLRSKGLYFLYFVVIIYCAYLYNNNIRAIGPYSLN